MYLLLDDHRATAAAISSASSSSMSSSRSHEGCRASFFARRSTVVAFACEEGMRDWGGKSREMKVGNESD